MGKIAPLEALREIESIGGRIAFNEKNKLGEVDYQWIKETIYKNAEIIEPALKDYKEKKDLHFVLIGGRENHKTANMRAYSKLKAFESIKDNMPNLTLLGSCDNYESYKEKSGDNLSKGEYNFLRDMLLWIK